MTIIDHDYVLDCIRGHAHRADPRRAAPLRPGNYTVTITSNGATIGSTAFEVR